MTLELSGIFDHDIDRAGFGLADGTQSSGAVRSYTML